VKKRLTTRRAFSLIELMVVILILAVVIAIIVPALGGARNAAKSVSSRATLTQVSNAASAYSNDHQETMPGYFTAEEMGDSENERRGFTELENVMLHLAGGLIDPTKPTFGGSGDDRIVVGPTTQTPVAVDLTLIGADTTKSGAYYTPEASLYRTETGQEAGSGGEDHKLLPDLVDAWGTPVLAWRRNEFGPVRITREEDFALEQSGGDRAWYYWNANAGFLKGKAVGKQTKSQADMSMIGGGAGMTAEMKSRSLTGFLGSPAYPADLDPPGGYEEVLPGASRGELVLHSAGADGVFLSRDSNGSKQFKDDRIIDYYRNFFNTKGQPLTGDGGQNETNDLLRAFDDLIQTGN
jgi:prepilin-type N-terminal cleavage/methylation domain-containing protein